jgi:hypothetical protein
MFNLVVTRRGIRRTIAEAQAPKNGIIDRIITDQELGWETLNLLLIERTSRRWQ